MSLPLRASLRKIAGFACGCLLVILILSPLVKVDLNQLLRELPELTLPDPNIEISDNDALLQQLICEQTASVIAQKAGELMISAEAEVILRYDSEIGSYVPDSVRITVFESKGTIEPLREYISKELAIPEERQTWILK